VVILKESRLVNAFHLNLVCRKPFGDELIVTGQPMIFSLAGAAKVEIYIS